MLYVEADLFEMPGVLVIPTNLGCVHGAGLAKAAKDRGLIHTPRCFLLPVKRHWRDAADTDLMKRGLRTLIRTARNHPGALYWLPLVGLGHGEGDPEVIVPLLVATVRACPGNVTLVVPTSEALAASPKGRARTDRTGANRGRILRLLEEA